MDVSVKRGCMILDQIADATGYLPSGEIARKLQISSKTVRKDIESMLLRVEQMGIHVVKKPGLGYRMDQGSVKLWRQRRQDFFRERAYSVREHRFHYILQRLLLAGEYIKSAELSEELFLSQPSVSAELRSIRQYLESYELTIENVPNYGIRIAGREQYIRSCMLDEYTQEQARQINPCTYAPFQALFTAASREQQAKIEKTVRSFLISEEDKPYYISEGYIRKFTLAIILATNCGGRRRPVSFSARETYETQMTRSYQAVKDLSQQLCEGCGICLKEEDLLYLGNLFLGYRTFLQFEDVSVKENYYRAVANASKVLMCLLTRYGVTEFAYNKNLRELLAAYLLPLEARMRTHATLGDDEILREINQSSIIAKEFAIYVGTYLEGIYRCPLHKNEYERLTLVFLGDVQSAGRQTKAGCNVAVLSCRYSRDVALSIAQQHLKRCEGLAKQVIALENYQVSAAMESCCDLLLTDIPAETFTGFRGTVLPYAFNLSQEDCHRVLNWYHGKYETWDRLKQIFQPELFFAGCKAHTLRELMELVQESLTQQGYADGSLHYDLLETAHPCSAVSNDGIGFIKLQYIYGEWSFCGVFQLAVPVEWQGTNLHLLLVLGIGTADASDFLLFNGWLEELLREKRTSLVEASSYPQFMELLQTYFFEH